MLAQWRDTKAILSGDDGQAKFDADIKDSALPKFTGKIVSMTPALAPKTIVVSVDPEKDGASRLHADLRGEATRQDGNR